MEEQLSRLFDLLATARVYDLEQPRRMHAPTFPARWWLYHKILGNE
jgi:hypothetical protein